jgi:restriction endonuclease S subunit
MSNNYSNNELASLSHGFVSQSREIGRQLSLRVDPKFRLFWDIQKGLTVGATTSEQKPFRDLLLPYCPKMLQKGALEEPRRIIDLADVEGRSSIILLDENGSDRIVSEIGSTRVDFGDSDLVFCRLEPYLGKILLNDPGQQWIGTSEWIPLRVDRNRVLPIFLKWLLLSPQFLNHGTFWKLRAGKRHARISERDLGSLYLPIPPIGVQKSLEPRLIELERLLTQKHRQLRTRAEVIDETLAAELEYQQSEFSLSDGPTAYFREASHIGKSLDLRSGVRFLRPEFDHMQDLLKSMACGRLRDLIDPVRSRLGATITPESYDEEGETLYISPDVIKGYQIDVGSATTVSQAFYEDNCKTSALRRSDLVISRSGIGIGKVAIYEEDRAAIVSDFTMRIRFNGRIDPFFGYCVCCSSLFQSQIKKHKRGAAVPNFFPIQMREFFFPCPQKSKQFAISEKVRAALGAMDLQRVELGHFREEIDRAIRDAVVQSLAAFSSPGHATIEGVGTA